MGWDSTLERGTMLKPLVQWRIEQGDTVNGAAPSLLPAALRVLCLAMGYCCVGSLGSCD